MTLWQGWSTEQRQVYLTRVVDLFLRDLGPDGQSTHAADELGIPGLQGKQVAVDLAGQYGLVDSGSLTFTPGMDALRLTTLGHQVRAEFAEMTKPVPRRLGARRALLHWLCDFPAAGAPNRMLEYPHCWFYGSRFTDTEINDAAVNLRERGFITALGSSGGGIMYAEIVARGRSCVEIYDGNPDEMEHPMSGTINNFHGPVNQHGNNSIGSSGVVTQTWTSTVTIGQTAADLAGLLATIRMMGVVPAEQQGEADQVSGELQAAAAGTIDPIPVLGRARAFFGKLNEVASTNPAAAAILTAAGNYAAVRMGLPTS
jgi:hypothetical protein